MPKNLRHTKQRTAILSALQKAEHPMTPKEIRDIAAEKAPGLGIATVYRNLRLLQETNEIQTVEVPGYGVCYMIPRGNHRAIVVCRKSKRIRIADASHVRIESHHLPAGFNAHEIQIFIYGHFDGE